MFGIFCRNCRRLFERRNDDLLRTETAFVGKTPNSVAKMKHIKVKQQTDGKMAEPNVVDGLRTVHRRNLGDRFEFNQNFPADDNVRAVSEFDAFVTEDDGNGDLCFRGNSARTQLFEHASLVNSFEKSGTERRVNSVSCTENLRDSFFDVHRRDSDGSAPANSILNRPSPSLTIPLNRASSREGAQPFQREVFSEKL